MMSSNDDTSRRCLKDRHNKWNARAVLIDKLTGSRRGLKGGHNKWNAKAVLDD
jgi:hypothetical protein